MPDMRKPATAAAKKSTIPRGIAPPPGRPAAGHIAELRVSGHLMSLDTGTFCVFHAPGSPVAAEPGNGLPAVRLSLPPGSKAEAARIKTLDDDGWLTGAGGAALIRVPVGPTQILVTVYQAPGQSPDNAPRLQVLRLGADNPATEAPAGSRVAADAEVIAHIQVAGDVGVRLGEWLGQPGSGQWIEGFSIHPPPPIGIAGIEYQAVLGRGWNSPWVGGGQFCGSRGMALPLLGLRLRLKDEFAARFEITCSASFVDGSRVGPVAAGEACECGSLAPLEAFQVTMVAKAVRTPAWLVPPRQG